MGADLYISKISEKMHEKYDPQFLDAIRKRDALQEMGKVKEADKAQKEVEKYHDLMNSEGYFRDSYNGTALFRYLYLTNENGEEDTLSWWRDVVPLQKRNGDISGEKLEQFLTLILAADLRLPTKKELIDNRCQVDATGEDSLEGWHTFLEKKREKLVELISQAIEMGEPISASL